MSEVYDEDGLAMLAERATGSVVAGRLDEADTLLADGDDSTLGYARETIAALGSGDLVRAAVALDNAWSAWIPAFVPLRRALADVLAARADTGDWAHRVLGVWAVGLSVDHDMDWDADDAAMLARRVAWAGARNIQFDGDAMSFVLARLFLAHGFVATAAYWARELVISAPSVFDELEAAAVAQLAAGERDWNLHAIAIRAAIRRGDDPAALVAAARAHDLDDLLISGELRHAREACAEHPALAGLSAGIPAPLGTFDVTAGVLSIGEAGGLDGHDVVVDALPGAWVASRAARWLIAHHADHGGIVAAPRWFEIDEVKVSQRVAILDAATMRGQIVDVRAGSHSCRVARDGHIVGVALALP